MGETGGFRDHVGLEVSADGDGKGSVTLTALDQHLNPHGTVHGGLIATMADTAMGAAVDTTTGEGERPVTIEMKVTYLEPARPGVLTARAQVRRRGRRVTIVEAEVEQEGDMVAHAIGTFTTVG